MPTSCIEILSASYFETGNIDGWINGTIDSSANFSNFLRFGDSNLATEKTFSGLPKDAHEILFEYDMYEIDSWDNEVRF
jgi:hypothetical protein